MGRITTPKYRIEWLTAGPRAMTHSAWETRFYGKANAANLEKVIRHMRESMKPGGVNEAAAVNLIGGRLVRNVSGGEVIAEFKFPMVEVN